MVYKYCTAALFFVKLLQFRGISGMLMVEFFYTLIYCVWLRWGIHCIVLRGWRETKFFGVLVKFQ